MFDQEFFPTPPAVIDKLLRPLSKDFSDGFTGIPNHRNVLEPSAGKGDICDRLVKVYHVDQKRIFCCETNEELQKILAGKGYRIVASDFMDFDDMLAIDLIVMNPPFSVGVQHLLRAWDVLKHGDIACILNAESLRNPYTADRKVLQALVAEHGKVQYHSNLFADAERRTGVDCALVWLHKARARTTSWFDGVEMDMDRPEPEEAFEASPLALRDGLDSLVNRYNRAYVLLVERNRLHAEFDFYTRGVRDPNWKRDDVDREQQAARAQAKHEDTLNEQIAELKKLFWDYVFAKTRISSAATSSVREDFEELRSRRSQMAFTRKNIEAILGQLLDNREEIMMQCVQDVFEKATRYHKQNTVHGEGWVSNKSWKIAEKIILPDGVYNDGSGWHPWSVGYQGREFFDDLDRVCCMLTGQKFWKEHVTYRYGEDQDPGGVLTIKEALEKRFKALHETPSAYHDLFDSEFFHIKIHKKGTVHLVFKDKDLRDRLNIAAAQGKPWVGGGY